MSQETFSTGWFGQSWISPFSVGDVLIRTMLSPLIKRGIVFHHSKPLGLSHFPIHYFKRSGNVDDDLVFIVGSTDLIFGEPISNSSG